MDKFTSLKSRPHWDWTGMQPNIALHLAFEKNLQTTISQRFVFTDKYVAQVLNNIAMKQTDHGNMMTMVCQTPSNFPTFLRPINAPML